MEEYEEEGTTWRISLAFTAVTFTSQNPHYQRITMGLLKDSLPNYFSNAGSIT